MEFQLFYNLTQINSKNSFYKLLKPFLSPTKPPNHQVTIRAISRTQLSVKGNPTITPSPVPQFSSFTPLNNPNWGIRHIPPIAITGVNECQSTAIVSPDTDSRIDISSQVLTLSLRPFKRELRISIDAKPLDKPVFPALFMITSKDPVFPASSSFCFQRKQLSEPTGSGSSLSAFQAALNFVESFPNP